MAGNSDFKGFQMQIKPDKGSDFTGFKFELEPVRESAFQGFKMEIENLEPYQGQKKEIRFGNDL